MPAAGMHADAPAAVSLRGAVCFLSFAFAYFFSAPVRGVTATLAPAFSAKLGLQPDDLGLLRAPLSSASPSVRRGAPGRARRRGAIGVQPADIQWGIGLAIDAFKALG